MPTRTIDLALAALRNRPSRLVIAACFLVACGGSAFQAASGDAGNDGTSVGPDGSGESSGDDATVEGGDAAKPIEGGADATIEAESGGAESSTGDSGGSVDGPAAEGASEGGGTEAAAEGGGVESGGPEGGTCITGEVCVPAAPGGWTGPVQFYYGNAAAPACPLFTTTGFSGGTTLTVPQAVCSTCTCSGSPTCSDPALTVYQNDSTCTSTPCVDMPDVKATCTTATYSCANTGTAANYVTIVSTPSASSCAASTQSPSLPPTTWNDHAQECNPAPAADSCGAGNVCTPTPPSPFKECVYQVGDVSCPNSSGPYSVKQLVDTTVADGRSCTGCSCGLATGTACHGVVGYTEGVNCVGGFIDLAMPVTCSQVQTLAATSSAYAKILDAGVPTPTTCAAAGGQPTGTALPATPMTVCCGP